jgi:adenylate cyclase
MDETGFSHHLAAILAADAAGYSRLMAADEHATVTALDAARAVFRSQTEAHHGRVVDMAGDSVLAVFETAAGAVSAALAVQASINPQADAAPEDRRMRFRIGVHMGDLIEKADGTVYGDGVNIAARLQALAEPGGATVSDAVRGAVRGKVAASFDDLGEQAVKNIAEPVRAFAVCAAGIVPAPTVQSRPAIGQIDLSLPDKPSIAVLPFVNMSGDPEQEYFTDGITEDIITELSRFHSLFVIARNSSFSYKGQSPDVRRVGKELGVRYVLEGSIRKSAQRIRVTGQLIDALTGNHLWAEKYDRVLEDIFELQEELTRSIVMAIAPRIDDAERDKVQRRRPENLGAYELGVSALAKTWAGYLNADVELRKAALAEAEAALAIDPRSSLALQVVAWAQLLHVFLGTAPDVAAAWQAGIAAVNRAIEIDRGDSAAYAAKACLLCFAADKQRATEDLPNARRAYELNPNNPWSVTALALSEMCTGFVDEAIVHVHEGMRLNPRDPLRFNSHLQLSMCHLLAGDYNRGVEFARLGIADAPGVPQLHGHLAMNLVGLGDIGAAKGACAEARRLAPAWVERCLAGRIVYRKPEHLRRATTFLRIAAGLEDPSAAEALR